MADIDASSNKIVRGLLIMAGTISLALGIIGIFIPVLPTTPFLLLSAACYSRSSKKFYDWLLSNRWFGNYIRNYREGRGVPLKVKLLTIIILWTTILTSAFLFVTNWKIQIMLIIIAIGVTIHIWKIKTYGKGRKSPSS